MSWVPARRPAYLRTTHRLCQPHYTLDSESGTGISSTWNQAALACLGHEKFSRATVTTRSSASFRTTRHRKKRVDKIAEHSPRVQRWMESITGFDCTLGNRKGSTNGNNADFLSRPPQPATGCNRSWFGRLTPVNDEATYLSRCCGLRTPSAPDASPWVSWYPGPMVLFWVGSF